MKTELQNKIQALNDTFTAAHMIGQLLWPDEWKLWAELPKNITLKLEEGKVYPASYYQYPPFYSLTIWPAICVPDGFYLCYRPSGAGGQLPDYIESFSDIHAAISWLKQKLKDNAHRVAKFEYHEDYYFTSK